MLGFVAEAFELRTALGSIVVVVALVIPRLILHRLFADRPRIAVEAA